MGSRCRKSSVESLNHSVEKFPKLLKHILVRFTARTHPNACDDCFLDPLLIFLLEKSHMNEFVQCFTSMNNAEQV